MSQKRSVIWLTPRKEFEIIVAASVTLADILRKLGIEPQAGNYQTLKRRLKEDGIETAHLPLGRLDFNKGRKVTTELIPLDEVLVEHSSYSRSSLKRRLLAEGLLKNECFECGQLPQWNGKPLVLVLDHWNGENDDNRFSNLRLLCPNCNSQQPTFCGRHRSKVSPFRKSRLRCSDCDKELSRRSVGNLCRICLGRNNRKVVRPPMEILISEIENIGYRATGKKYGVSDNTIRKWIR